MNNRQVAHLWANQARASARGSNFYFDGPALYSYGRHFCVGRIVENKRGKRAFLLNADSYSNSTSRHQSYARQAIASGATIFYVPGASSRHSDNRERFRDNMRAALARIPGRRNAARIESDILDAQRSAASFNEYGAFFGMRGRVKVPRLAPADAARLARYRLADHERQVKAAAKYEAGAPERARLQAERDARDAERDRERRADFRAGKRREWGIGGPCMLRLNGNTFETSQGADVPLPAGVAMLRHIAQVLSLHNLPVVYGENGPRAGGFQLREITAAHVRIGCHEIPLSECAAMAALVGVEWPA